MKHVDSEYRSFKSKVILFLKGYSMGFADIIPGVSGGTIALISGIYEHLIYAISSIKFKRVLAIIIFLITKQEKYKSDYAHIPFIFLIVLGSGIATGILSMSKIIPYLMEVYPFYTYSLFFGLILFSISIPYKKMDHTYKEYFLMLIFTLITFYITGLSPFEKYTIQLNIQNNKKKIPIDDSGKFKIYISNNEIEKADLEILKEKEVIFKTKAKDIEHNFVSITPEESLFLEIKTIHKELEIKGILSKKSVIDSGVGKYLWIFFVASIAICAMILPGISGAYILVLFGEYQNILKALHNKELFTIGIFLLGVGIGLLSFVRILRFLLNKYHSYTMASLTGFLIGSLNKIFPLRYTKDYDLENLSIGVFIAILGAMFLYVLERISIKIGDPEPPG